MLEQEIEELNEALQEVETAQTEFADAQLLVSVLDPNPDTVGNDPCKLEQAMADAADTLVTMLEAADNAADALKSKTATALQLGQNIQSASHQSLANCRAQNP